MCWRHPDRMHVSECTHCVYFFRNAFDVFCCVLICCPSLLFVGCLGAAKTKIGKLSPTLSGWREWSGQVAKSSGRLSEIQRFILSSARFPLSSLCRVLYKAAPQHKIVGAKANVAKCLHFGSCRWLWLVQHACRVSPSCLHKHKQFIEAAEDPKSFLTNP